MNLNATTREQLLRLTQAANKLATALHLINTAAKTLADNDHEFYPTDANAGLLVKTVSEPLTAFLKAMGMEGSSTLEDVAPPPVTRAAAVPPASPKPPAKPKEPWEFTQAGLDGRLPWEVRRDEFVELTSAAVAKRDAEKGNGYAGDAKWLEGFKGNQKIFHGRAVKSAQAAGKVVPPEVLADYTPPAAPPYVHFKAGTVRRDMLKKLAEAGRLVAVETYHFDDQTGSDRTNKETPVKFGSDHKEGTITLRDHDFTSTSGHARANESGLVTLHVHSNCHYVFRVVPPK